MKKYSIAILFILLGLSLFAQSSKKEELQTLNRLLNFKMQGLIPMRFANALDNAPIAGALIEIEGIGNFTTDTGGIITFPQREDGAFTLVFSKEGFITTSIKFSIRLSTVVHNRFSISPVMTGDYYRIVLDWGDNPADLDLHLEKSGGYHISWQDMHNAADGSVTLDRDDRNGFGPETITIMETGIASSYLVYVVDYTNLSKTNSRALSQSTAVVRLYNRDRLILSFEIPSGSAGVRWDVFKIAQGQVTAIDTIGIIGTTGN
jgi:hypothetical protein